MKTRTLKTKVNLKQKSISRGVGLPGKNEGKEGDFTVRHLKGRGLFLFYKWMNDWYSARFSLKSPRNIEGREDVILPIGRKPTKKGEITMNSGGKTFASKGGGVHKQVVGMDKDNILDIDTVKTSRANTTSTSIGVTNDLSLINKAGDSSLTLLTKYTTGAGETIMDSYVNLAYQKSGEVLEYYGFQIGVDGSDTSKLHFKYMGGTAGNVTPSSGGTDKLTLDSSGNLVTAGTLTIGNITSDTAGDNYLVEVSGEVKKRTPAEVLSDIGASSVAALNDLSDVTYSSGDLTIDSLDTIISGALILDSSGDITLSADGGNVIMHDGTLDIFNFNVDNCTMKISDDANVNDYFQISVGAEGATTIGTVDADTVAAHLTLAPDGDIILDSAIDIELNAEGGDVVIKDGSATHFLFDCDFTRFKMYDDTDEADYFSITVSASGASIIGTYDDGATIGHLTLRPDGDLVLDPASQKTIINATDGLYFDSGTHTYIDEESDDRLRFTVGTDEMLILDEASDAITMAATNWIAGTVSGATITEFSAANSAYAGMILGYTMVGADVADDSYLLTTSFVCFPDSGGAEIASIFKTPPSENVEIEVELYFSSGSGASDLFLTLSNAAAFGSNSLHHTFQLQKVVVTPSRGWGGTVTQKFYLNQYHLAAIGSSNTIFIAAKTDSTSGTPIIEWGGDAAGDPTNLVMKATALPATIVEGS